MTDPTQTNQTIQSLDTLYSLIFQQRGRLRRTVQPKRILGDQLAKLEAAGDYLGRIAKHREAIDALMEEIESSESTNQTGDKS